MNIHTFSANVKAVMSFDAVLANSTQNGAYVDTQGFRRAVLAFNAWTGTATTVNFTLEESATGSGAGTLVTGATLGSAIAATTADAGTQLVDIDLAKRLRYLRVNVVGTGAAGNASGVFLLYEPLNSGVTNTVTPISL